MMVGMAWLTVLVVLGLIVTVAGPMFGSWDGDIEEPDEVR